MRHSQSKRSRYHTYNRSNNHRNPFRDRGIEDSLHVNKYLRTQRVDERNQFQQRPRRSEKISSPFRQSRCDSSETDPEQRTSSPRNIDPKSSLHKDLRHKLNGISVKAGPSHQQAKPSCEQNKVSNIFVSEDNASNGFKVNVSIGGKVLRAIVNMRRKSSIINRTVIKLMEEKSNPINYDTILVKMSVGSKTLNILCVTNYKLNVPVVLGREAISQFGFKLSICEPTTIPDECPDSETDCIQVDWNERLF